MSDSRGTADGLPGSPGEAVWRRDGLLADCPPGRLDLSRPHEGIVIPATTDPSAPRQRRRHDLESSPGRISPEAVPTIAQLLGIRQGGYEPTDATTRLPPVDSWVRGQDLTAVYEPCDGRQLRITAMWRRQLDAHGRDGGAVSLWQLILSAQTSSLESDPSVDVVSRIPLGRVIARFTTPCLATLVEASSGRAVLVAMHPMDIAAFHRASDPAGAGWETAARSPTSLFEIGTQALEGPAVVLTCRLFARVLEKGVLLRGRVLAAVGPSGADCTWASEALTAFGREPTMLST